MENIEDEIVKEDEIELEDENEDGLLLDETEIINTAQHTHTEETCFNVLSTTGISINGVQFSKGAYRLGQLVGTLTIDRELMNTILSADAQAIQSNPHSA